MVPGLSFPRMRPRPSFPPEHFFLMRRVLSAKAEIHLVSPLQRVFHIWERCVDFPGNCTILKKMLRGVQKGKTQESQRNIRSFASRQQEYFTARQALEAGYSYPVSYTHLTLPTIYSV